VGLACLAVATSLVRRPDGDRRSFAIVVAACIQASPIVWPNYAALLFVPIAITWPRLAPAWFFGYAVWLLSAVTDGTTPDTGPAPPGVPEQAWLSSHAESSLWFAGGTTIVVAIVGVATAVARTRQRQT
jgi:hypothetical protein